MASKRRRKQEEEEEEFLKKVVKEVEGGEAPAFVRGSTTIIQGVAKESAVKKELWKPGGGKERKDHLSSAASPPPSKKKSTGPAKPKMMDIMLKEMQAKKRDPLPVIPVEETRVRESFVGGGNTSMTVVSGGRGAVYDGCDSSNISVDNIDHRTVNEEILVKAFGQFGAIGTVKIMWPRTEEEKMRPFTKGFVNFMEVADAQKAMEAMQNRNLCGCLLRLGWGRPMPKPPLPLYVPPHQVQQTTKTLAKLHADVPHVRVPSDLPPETRRVIDALAVYVAKYGIQFEEVIKAREKNNPHMQFITAGDDDPAHVFYKWRVYALCQGDSLTKYRTTPFQMFMSGPVWVPPSPDGTSDKGVSPFSKSDELSPDERNELIALLRGVTTRAPSIKEVMIWCLERAPAAGEIVELIKEALTLPETPPQTKLARLYLASDVLYNSGSAAPKASGFRRHLEQALPAIFRSLGEACAVHQSLRTPCLRVLRTWEGWSVYPQNFLTGLRGLLQQGS